jgi:starch synthase
VRVLSVASEVFPLIKTGGLADVAGALPPALESEGIRVTTLLPGYPVVMARASNVKPLHSFPDLFGGPARLVAFRDSHLDLIALDAPHLYARPGNPYENAAGAPWPDNALRFAALGYAAAELGLGRAAGYARPDIVHAHDWQSGLAPAYLALSGETRPGTVMTIHNLAFQGQFPATLLSQLKLPPSSYATNGVEHYGAIGYLKAGLYYADRLTTVSPTYAREIQTQEGGMGLHGLLAGRADVLSGIVNGIDVAAGDPAHDPNLAANFSIRSLRRRLVNKHRAREKLLLSQDDSPLLVVITRLAWQKGVDVLIEALPDIVGLGAQVAVLGAGDPALEAALMSEMTAHPGRIGVQLGYDESFSHLLQGGADALLVPSRFEPCGLTQLYALHYGAVPIVARTGGLADTVIDANEAALEDAVATGFTFSPVEARALTDAVARALALYGKPTLWRAMQRRGMTRRLSWTSRAPAYAALYRELASG